jgi:hypothetical protein
MRPRWCGSRVRSVGKAQRVKGARWERQVKRLFLEAMPGSETQRAIGQYRGGAEAPDVLVPGLFWLECKVGQRPPLMRALHQALGDCPKGQGLIAAAVVKQDRKRPVALLELDDFLDILKEWWELKNAAG